MSYSPIHVGDTAARFVPTFKYDSGEPIPLTGMTIHMKLINEADTSIVKICDPANWTIDDEVNGKAHYHYEASDIDTEGIFDIDLTIVNSDNEPVHCDDGCGDLRKLQILPA